MTARTVEVKTTVDIPAPHFRGIRYGEVSYVALEDVVEFLGEAAAAFDKAHAAKDIGRSLLAVAETINASRAKEFSA